MKKTILMIFIGFFFFAVPFSAHASDGIPLQKDLLLSSPIMSAQDLPEALTFVLYDSETATVPIGSQTFARGEYSVDFEFSKSDGISGGDVARVNAEFTNKLNIDNSESSSRPREIWVAIEVGGSEVGGRTKVSDETMVQLLLASDASVATFLTLVYEGEDNPIATIYKELPISSLDSDGAGSSLSEYFSAVAAGSSEGEVGANGLTNPNNWYQNGNNIYYTYGWAGIGTTAPSLPLDVVGGIDSEGVLRFTQSGMHVIELYPSSDGLKIYDRTAGTFRGMLMGDNGRVGIGTTVPNVPLHVVGGINNDSGILRFTQSGMHVIELYPSSDGLKIYDRTAGAYRGMLMSDTGKVGIGTTNPTYELAVNGTIRCKELIVDTGWSDFVFEDGYRLPPLTEVENFIEENQHLPGIPTAAEVKEKGVSVGNISSKLLQKIEELTLYVIDLKKENESLKSQLTAIEKQVHAFSN